MKTNKENEKRKKKGIARKWKADKTINLLFKER
jgi:hypothetical protein